MKYHQTFLPSLDLYVALCVLKGVKDQLTCFCLSRRYDRDAVVDSVAADFILIDELGNSGLSYTHTAREVTNNGNSFPS